MCLFYGCVILESLKSKAPLTGWTPLAQRVVDMPDDPDATVWHVQWFQLREQDLLSRLPALAEAMRPNWYAHFWEGDDLCVILGNRFFWASSAKKETWQAFIAYGETVGVGRKWTESIPTQLPSWVQAALSTT
ncbi:MAG TPA: hypothetical protein VD902_02440 [Symbiobacteriaceae bacterium]|nr:hypothetical protein [Symbiobacteriaceae bacterium]